jgi:hypothetical protein
MAIWVANTERTGERLNSGTLDRAAVAPIERGETAYERAVREARERERSTGGAAATGTPRRRAS